jgi:hypothetical protein
LLRVVVRDAIEGRTFHPLEGAPVLAGLGPPLCHDVKHDGAVGESVCGVGSRDDFLGVKHTIYQRET